MSRSPDAFARRVLGVAAAAGRRAAVLCQAVQDTADLPGAIAKADATPVTIADYGSQAVILDAVRREFPDHDVIAEEGAALLRQRADSAEARWLVDLATGALGRRVAFEAICDAIDYAGTAGSEFAWCIDPIDGTKGFLRREQYAVAIGLLREGVPWAGVLVCPNLPLEPGNDAGPRGLLFAAARGLGCTLEVLGGGSPRAARVSARDQPQDWRVLGSVEASHGDPILVADAMAATGIGGGIVRYDSQAKYGVLAAGGAEIYLRPQAPSERRECVWDHAAGVVVCEEAGGRVTDLDGAALDFRHGRLLERNRGVLATAGPQIHAFMLEALRRL